MNRTLLILVFSIAFFKLKGQVTSIAPGEYKSIIVQNYSGNGDYTNCLILLHEASDGTLINANYAIGTITGLRGSNQSWNRVNIAEVNSASSYGSNSAIVTSVFNNGGRWKLKTCVFNGKNYLALDVPYNPSHHDHGYKFTGWTLSTGENMLAVPYMFNGAPVNQNVLSNIQDFVPNQAETHDVQEFNISGNVNIGTDITNPAYQLQVKGKIRSQEVKVENNNWPDYVFARDYQLPTLQETEKHIKDKGHLPGIPSAAEVKANGIDLGEMNAKLLQKIEELTLQLINESKSNVKNLEQVNQELEDLRLVNKRLAEKLENLITTRR